MTSCLIISLALCLDVENVRMGGIAHWGVGWLYHSQVGGVKGCGEKDER